MEVDCEVNQVREHVCLFLFTALCRSRTFSRNNFAKPTLNDVFKCICIPACLCVYKLL